MNSTAPTFRPAPWPDVDFAAFGPVEMRPVSRMQSLTASFMARNWTHIPHVTHHDEVDVTELDDRRRARNARPDATRLSPLVPLMKAVAAALRRYPVFNTSLDATGKFLAWKDYVHLGVATETPAGLLVPVIRDCDKRPLDDLANELAARVEKARTRGLSMAEMSGGCFTITSLGNIGGIAFTPIVNAPEVAILGVCRSIERPVRDGAGLAWRRMLPLSLSYDHRVINGADAARFVSFVGERLADATLLEH